MEKERIMKKEKKKKTPKKKIYRKGLMICWSHLFWNQTADSSSGGCVVMRGSPVTPTGCVVMRGDTGSNGGVVMRGDTGSNGRVVM